MISNRLQVKSVTLSPLLPPSRCYIRQKPISSSPPPTSSGPQLPTTPSHLIHRRATPSGTISTDKLSHTLLCVSLHSQCQRVLSQTDEIRETMIIRHFSWETVAALVGVVHIQLGEFVSQRSVFSLLYLYLSPFLSFLNNSILVEFVSDVESAAATGSRPSSHYSQAALNPQSCRCKIS